MTLPFVPSFTCKYCGLSKSAIIDGDVGVFVPCQCAEARKQRDQDHYIAMEEKKKRRRSTR